MGGQISIERRRSLAHEPGDEPREIGNVGRLGRQLVALSPDLDAGPGGGPDEAPGEADDAR